MLVWLDRNYFVRQWQFLVSRQICVIKFQTSFMSYNSGSSYPQAIVTRFAPSPNGNLHLGHAFAALYSAHLADQSKGQFLLRFEDIDTERCRVEFEQSIIQDLRWLGLRWNKNIRRQSLHFKDYKLAIDRLDSMDLLYPCFCTRRDIRSEIARASEAPSDREHPVYPGTCRQLSQRERRTRINEGQPYALRLMTDIGMDLAGSLVWLDKKKGIVECRAEQFGDVILARKDFPTSYHLSVTIDDHIQGVTLVTRGEDLYCATHIHRLLQALLDLSVPMYDHHTLIQDEKGNKLSKRNSPMTLKSLRETGNSPAEVAAQTGFKIHD